MKNIIGFEKKKNITFNKKKLKSHQDTKVCNICEKKRFLKNVLMITFLKSSRLLPLYQ